MMITGDARDTAVAIARDVNILPPKGTPGGDNVKVSRFYVLKMLERRTTNDIDTLFVG